MRIQKLMRIFVRASCEVECLEKSVTVCLLMLRDRCDEAESAAERRLGV